MVISSTATGSAARPSGASRGTRGSARDTAAAAEARKPARVIPIWMVDRNWLGSRASLATSRPCSPSCSSRRSCPSRNEIRATSLPAKAALITTSSRTSPISSHGICIATPSPGKGTIRRHRAPAWLAADELDGAAEPEVEGLLQGDGEEAELLQLLGPAQGAAVQRAQAAVGGQLGDLALGGGVVAGDQDVEPL